MTSWKKKVMLQVMNFCGGREWIWAYRWRHLARKRERKARVKK